MEDKTKSLLKVMFKALCFCVVMAPLIVNADTLAFPGAEGAGKYRLTNIETAKEAYESTLMKSGSSLVRDEVDKRIIQSIINRTGKVIDSQKEVGGWDIYPSVVRPAGFDTDRDGMPDAWERKANLNPTDPADGYKDRNSDGFTNLEEYLNSLTQWEEKNATT